MPYINKVVFAEFDEIGNLDTKYGYQVVQRTDYGTAEILADTIQDLLTELEGENKNEYDFTKQELLEDLHNSLGETADLLLNGDIDFVLVV